jgi:hypothetical protein
MPTTKTDAERIDAEQQTRETQNAAIGQQVIRALGTPDDLHDLQVRRLWEDRYRVNIFVGSNATTAKIANSYFVHADSDGQIVRSIPLITKQY